MVYTQEVSPWRAKHFASCMIARSISSTVLAKLMGHETSAITESRYVHLFDKRRADEAVRQAMIWPTA